MKKLIYILGSIAGLFLLYLFVNEEVGHENVLIDETEVENAD